MHLKQGTDSHTYKVEAIDLELQLELRLKAFGLTEGTIVTVLNNRKKGALTIKFRGTRFAVGKRIAEHITLTEVKNEQYN